MIALIDYGVGNLRSVYKALSAVGAEVLLTSDVSQLDIADKVVLPGVGAFGDGMAGLQSRGLFEPIRRVASSNIPFLGICLGMQLLFEESDEAPQIPGLSLMSGFVHRFPADNLKIPQTGWNQINPTKMSHLLDDVGAGSYAYFNHGYYCDPDQDEDILAITEYGIEYASVVGHGNMFGVQFHPEKSQAVGLQILKNFLEL